MYQFYNAHPKGLFVGDCVKRAITKATGMDYQEVQRELNRYKKVTGAKSYNSDYNPHKYVENVLKGVKMSFPAQKGKPRMNAQRFCEQYSKGNYILNMAGHWSCVVDGVIYDTWDCSDKCVYTAYKVDKISNKHFTYKAKDKDIVITIMDNDITKEITIKSKLKSGYIQCLNDLGFTKR